MLKLGAIVGASLFVTACSTMSGRPLVDDQGGEPGRVIIINESKSDVTGILVSRCNTFIVGFNRLKRTEYLKPGQEKTFEISPGCWDLQIGGDGYQSSSKIEINPGRDHTVHYK